MEQQKLTAFINDSSELAINLEWAGVSFEPADEWSLIFTAKDSDADLDSAAVFQKASGAGITVSGSVATVELVPADTESLTDGRRLFDVQAQNILTQKVRTVAFGEVYVMRDITRLTETSVPVTTTETPLPFAKAAVEIHAAAEKETIADADEFGGADSEASWGLKKWSWSTIKATLKTYFDTLYSAVSHSHAWGAIAGKPSTFAPSAHTHPNTEIAGLGTAATLDSSLTHSAGQAIIWDTDLSTTHDNLGLGTAATADVESLSSVPINAEFVFEGDSITANTGQPSWVPEAMLLTNFIDRGGYNIEAVSGSTLADMAARYSAQVYPHRPTSGDPVFLFLLIGANDTIASATWLTNLENYVTTAKSDGFTVVCLTPFIRSGVDHPTRYAAKLLNSQVPDRVINTASLFRDASNTAYFSDGVHLTASAAKMLAGFVDAEMGKMTLPGDSAITVNGAGIGANVKNPRAAIDAKGEFSLMIGDSNAENTAKGSRIALRPYGLETDTPPSVIGGYVDASNSRLLIGGGTNSGFAATAVEFYTAANNSTLSGSLRGKLIGAGYWIFGANSTTVPAACTIGILDPTPFLRLSASDGTTTNSAYLAVVPSNGYAATGVLSGETLLAPVSGKALAIASSATGVTAIVRMRVKPNGAINYVPIAEPSSPSEGDTYMDSTSHKLRTYDGTAWQDHW